MRMAIASRISSRHIERAIVIARNIPDDPEHAFHDAEANEKRNERQDKPIASNPTDRNLLQLGPQRVALPWCNFKGMFVIRDDSFELAGSAFMLTLDDRHAGSKKENSNEQMGAPPL